MTPATPATPVPCAPSASSGLLHRRGWLAGVLALTVAALPGVALARPRRRPVRRRKRRGLTAAQRGSGRVQRIDASLPDPIAGELPGIESKGGFARPSFAERRLQRKQSGQAGRRRASARGSGSGGAGGRGPSGRRHQPTSCQAPSFQSARQLVNAGQGVGFFPRTFIAEDIRRGSLREIPVRDLVPISRDSALVRRLRDGPPSPAGEQMVACLRAEASAQGLLRGGRVPA